ncbi:MAG: hypothetical protein H7Z74_06445 [Anaerolineae bacterium]|nr:hypothetical protein [Gemmatimonadaceae bacterium]
MRILHPFRQGAKHGKDRARDMSLVRRRIAGKKSLARRVSADAAESEVCCGFGVA